MKQRLKVYGPGLGLNTTQSEYGSAPGGYQTFANVRTSDGLIEQRYGMKRLAVIAPGSDSAIIDADGTNDSVAFAHVTGQTTFAALTSWTIEALVQCDSLASRRAIFARDHATNCDINLYMDSTSGGRVVAEVQDSATAVTTLTRTGIAASTVVAVMLSWDGATLTLSCNNSSTTGTLGSGAILSNTTNQLYVYRDNTGRFMDGRVEFVRILNVAKTTNENGWSRLYNPRAPDVLADWVTEVDSGTGYVLDRSRFENHGDVAGSPATTTTLIGNPPVPVQAMMPMLDSKNGRRLIVAARGSVYSGTY